MIPRALILAVAVAALAACDTQREGGGDGDAASLNDLGVAHMGRYDYEAARMSFEQSLDAAPDPRTRVNLAIAILNRQQDGDEQRALAILDQVSLTDPSNLRARYLRGLIHLYLGETGAAIDSLRQVVRAVPDDAYAMYFLGQALLQQGDFEPAADRLLEAIRLDPYLRSAYWAGAQALKRLGRSSDAEKLLADYERFQASPRAKLADFAYRRMGPLAEALPTTLKKPERQPRPDGDLFAGSSLVAKTAFADASLTGVDVDSDSRLELIVTSAAGHTVFRESEDGGLAPAVMALPDDNALALMWGDIDNDGRVDVVTCSPDGVKIWRQVDHGAFEQMGQATARPCSAGRIFDADHDGDLDIFYTGARGSELVSNNGDGSFRLLADELGIAGNAGFQVLPADLDSDRDLDIIVLGENEHEVWRNDRTWRYERYAGLDDFRTAELVAATTADVDADGRTEIFGLAPSGAVVRWHRPANDWIREEIAAATETRPLSIAAQDIDGDGRQEIVRTTTTSIDILDAVTGNRLATLSGDALAASITLPLDTARGPALAAVSPAGLAVWPPGIGRYEFMTISLSGKSSGEQMRSNASGIGTDVAIRLPGDWVTATALDTHSGPGQSLLPLAVGMRGHDEASYVELEWSDGVSQTETGLATGMSHEIQETQRQLASCPVLFAWDGQRWRFVSDVLGVGGIGFFAEPGVYAPPRPFESWLMEEDALGIRDGRLHLILGEPMEETAYLDAVSMHVIDIPEAFEVVLDERMQVSGPAVTSRPIAFRTAFTPVRAINDRGEDVTSTVTAADRIAAPVGAIDPRFIGLLDKQHVLTLEFGMPLDRPGAVLVADGWIEYPYSQTVFAAWQAGKRYEAVTLEARDGRGRWHTIATEFGYPAGMPRTMAFPVGKLPEGSTAIRLSTNMEVYWDRVRIAFEEDQPALRKQTLQPVAARLGRAGFARRTTGPQRLPHYDYADRATYWDAKYARGFYTSYGDVLALVAEHDGAVAIFGGGEQTRLEFPAPPPAPAGMRRYYAIDFRGWAKDLDLYTGNAETVGPLPEADPVDREKRQALHERFNLRFQHGL